MKRISLAILLALALPSVAGAATGPTAYDRAQYAKLAALVGTWHCVDTPANKKPDVMTVSEQGNFYVTRETGDSPATVYARWNHTYQLYQETIVNNDGSVYVITSKSASPTNATWTVAYPSGIKATGTTVLSGNGYTTVVKYIDDKGKPAQSKSVCTKQ
jgi:hypothetical protein